MFHWRKKTDQWNNCDVTADFQVICLFPEKVFNSLRVWFISSQFHYARKGFLENGAGYEVDTQNDDI